MEPLDINAITKMIREARRRPSYIVSVLEFQLGRKPTQEEIDFVNRDARLRRAAHEKWVAAQPWHTKKRYVEKRTRIETILMKRYDVPQWLIDKFVREIEPDPYDY